MYNEYLVVCAQKSENQNIFENEAALHITIRGRMNE